MDGPGNGARHRFEGGPWPTPDQALLLTAAMLPGPGGVAAFKAWRARVDPDGFFGNQILRLLPLVYFRMHAQGV